MNDLIGRQAAIDALVGITMFKTKHELMQRVNASVQDEQGWLGAVAECLDEIEDLPSAQPVRHGKWILEHEEPTVDAIPISWIKEWVEEIKDHPSYTEKEKTLCIEEFEDMLGAWAERKEE